MLSPRQMIFIFRAVFAQTLLHKIQRSGIKRRYCVNTSDAARYQSERRRWVAFVSSTSSTTTRHPKIGPSCLLANPQPYLTSLFDLQRARRQPSKNMALLRQLSPAATPSPFAPWNYSQLLK